MGKEWRKVGQWGKRRGEKRMRIGEGAAMEKEGGRDCMRRETGKLGEEDGKGQTNGRKWMYGEGNRSRGKVVR